MLTVNRVQIRWEEKHLTRLLCPMRKLDFMLFHSKSLEDESLVMIRTEPRCVQTAESGMSCDTSRLGGTITLTRRTSDLHTLDSSSH